MPSRLPFTGSELAAALVAENAPIVTATAMALNSLRDGLRREPAADFFSCFSLIGELLTIHFEVLRNRRHIAFERGGEHSTLPGKLALLDVFIVKCSFIPMV